ncbi:MAG: TIGR02757 family protein [Nitrospinae bacterium]|nr:TIGR02757 family protein [Nitrospinota bacterium]
MERERILKIGLDELYKKFDRSMISPDPLECVPTKGAFKDVELSAFLAAVFAYGRADLIVRNVRLILGEMGRHPHKTLATGAYRGMFRGFKYRFHKRPDLLWLLDRLKGIYEKHGTLENAFCSVGETQAERLAGFCALFRKKGEQLSQAKNFLVTSPDSGAACKRINLFLRWMVRKDSVDLGLWKKIRPSELIIPLDVHVNRIAGRLSLVNPKGAGDFKKALALTEKLREFDPNDPVKYDFAICSLGKLGHCAKKPDLESCDSCVFSGLCSKQ